MSFAPEVPATMLIAGAEPVIVDTGSVNNRDQWLEDVFGAVDPSDVRWVFPSHDHSDHTGNLRSVMESCPNATLGCSWAIVERFSNAFGFPLERCRWLNDGEADRVRALGMTTIAPAHSPVITPANVNEAFALLRDIPDTPVPPAPDQNVLDATLATVG